MNENDENYMTKGKMKPYFTNQCFKGFSPEEPNNFYRVYDRLFKQLDKEEELEEGLSKIEAGFLKASDEQKHLHPWIGAELNKMKKAVAHIKSKILKEKKKSQEENLLKIQKIKETLFPSKQLQERHQNLLHFCNANSYQSVIDNLYEGIDPLNDGFTIISEISVSYTHLTLPTKRIV